VKQALVKKLSDLPPLEFVSRRSNAIEGDNGGSSPGRVRNGGVLITLGPIRATGHPVAVGASLWINGLAGSWQTYVLKARTGRWLVTGTAGPTAIS